MDFLVHFFRDILDGPVYWIMVGMCFFLILFILGFLIDRHEKNEKLKGLVEASPSGKERVYVTDEMTAIESNPSIKPEPVSQNTSVDTLEATDTKSVSVLELSSDDYQDNTKEISSLEDN